jgi:hypothetical protein
MNEGLKGSKKNLPKFQNGTRLEYQIGNVERFKSKSMPAQLWCGITRMSGDQKQTCAKTWQRVEKQRIRNRSATLVLLLLSNAHGLAGAVD